MMETIFTILPNTAIMFNSIQGFGDQLFSVIVLVIAAGISSHFCFGYGTKKAKETFIALILVLIVGTQLFHLINAATYVPASKFFVFDVRTTVNLLRFIFIPIIITRAFNSLLCHIGNSPSLRLSSKSKRLEFKLQDCKVI